MTEAHREIERKLRPPPGFALPDLTTIDGVTSVEPQPAFTMSNTYYDTPDLRLFRWGITLRLRQGSPDAGWHLKLPVDSAAAGARGQDTRPLPHSVGRWRSNAQLLQRTRPPSEPDWLCEAPTTI